MEDQKEVALETTVSIAGYEFTPISWTLRHRLDRDTFVSLSMAKEALGVIIRDVEGYRALMVDGRELTLEELALEYPSLAESLSRM
jgi:hypothetical protein